MEDQVNSAQSALEQAESVQMPLASEQANLNFQLFLTGLSDEERETQLDEQYLKDNFRLKEIHSTLELNVVKNIYNTIVQKNRQMTDKRMKKNWTDDETSLLLWIVKVLSLRKDDEPDDFTNETWMEIAKMIPYKAWENCKLRWLYLKKNSVQCTPWTDDEDQKLREIILNKGANSNKWNEIAKDLYNSSTSKTKTFRKGKQCRERWNNHLDPDMKRGQWTDTEDLQLLQLSYENGNKWSYIAKQLKERTENAVKNRYKSLLRKEEKENKTSNTLSSPVSLSQASLQLISSSSQSTIIQTSTFIQCINAPPTSPEQQKIYNIIIKLMNKISSDNANPQSSSSIKNCEEKIDEEDNEEDEQEDNNEDDQIEDEEGNEQEEENNSPLSNNSQKTKKKATISKQTKKAKEEKQRKCSNDTEMQIEGKNDNTPTAAHTECNTTDLQMSDNKVTTQSTIFTPSNSPNRGIPHLRNEEDGKEKPHCSIFGQKVNCESAINPDEVTTANNIGSTSQSGNSKPKKTQKQPRKKKQAIAANSEAETENNCNNQQGGVSTFSDALMLQPHSLSRSSSPSLANGEASSINNAKKKKQKKNDNASITTASTATHRDSVISNKKPPGFPQRNSIQSCNTPIGTSQLFNPLYSNNVACSPNTQLINQLNSFSIRSNENTPSSVKRRSTFGIYDFQSAIAIDSIHKRRNCANSQIEDESENSQEEERVQRTKKIIVLAGNKTAFGDMGSNIPAIEESDESNLKKMDIEMESNSPQQLVGGLLQQSSLSLLGQLSNSDENNENLNNINIMRRISSQQNNMSNLKFSSNNSAFKQFSSSPLQGSLSNFSNIRPKQSSLQLSAGSIGHSPLQKSAAQAQEMSSPMNSPILFNQLNQCIEQQSSYLLNNKNIDFSSLLKTVTNNISTINSNKQQLPQNNNNNNINLFQQTSLLSKSSELSQSKGFQKNKNFKQPSLFQPINPSLIITNNQQ